MGPGGGGPNFILFPEFLIILVRSPCRNLNSYDKPFWPEKEREKKRKISASADVGPRPWVCARETLRSIQVSAESPSNISPNPSEVMSEVSEP